MTIEFNTREYEFSHGRSPRGRGSWAFFFNTTSSQIYWTPGCTTYGEAKKMAREEAKRRFAKGDFVEIIVGS